MTKKSTELSETFVARFQGHMIPYTMKPLESEMIRNLAHMRSPESDVNWGIDMYIDTIYGRPASEANSKVQWVVWQDSQDFLTHMDEGIGRVGSPYESPEAKQRREEIEALLKSSQKSG